MSEKNFWRITLDTNPDYCNLKCIMCEDHSPYSASKAERKKLGILRDNMSPALLERTIRQAAEMGITEVIPSTMGEPLIYRHFDLILDLCSELNLRLNLTTNGTFPAPEKNQNVEYWARRIVPITNDVKISWNGATEVTQENIMQGTTLQSHIEKTRRFIRMRDELCGEDYCSVTMQLTFLRNNIAEIPAMLGLALDMGFDRMKGHHLWAHFPEIKNLSLRSTEQLAERWNETCRHCHEVVEKHNRTSTRKFTLDNFFELTLDKLEDVAPNGKCPFLNKEIWIDPSGQFNVCCAPDQQRKTLGDFGNLTKHSLKELANSTAYNQLVSSYHENPLCQSCNMRRPT